MENTNKCPCCSHHCDRNNLQCGKGEAYFNGEANVESSHSHSHSKEGRHSHGRGHGHHRPEFPAGSLADLLAKCGHRLFHGGSEGMFAALSDDESATLKRLLQKILGE